MLLLFLARAAKTFRRANSFSSCFPAPFSFFSIFFCPFPSSSGGCFLLLFLVFAFCTAAMYEPKSAEAGDYYQ
jgi:hypothetical protein